MNGRESKNKQNGRILPHHYGALLVLSQRLRNYIDDGLVRNNGIFDMDGH